MHEQYLIVFSTVIQAEAAWVFIGIIIGTRGKNNEGQNTSGPFY